LPTYDDITSTNCCRGGTRHCRLSRAQDWCLIWIGAEPVNISGLNIESISQTCDKTCSNERCLGYIWCNYHKTACCLIWRYCVIYNCWASICDWDFPTESYWSWCGCCIVLNKISRRIWVSQNHSPISIWWCSWSSV